MMYGNEQDSAAFVRREANEARIKLELAGKK